MHNFNPKDLRQSDFSSDNCMGFVRYWLALGVIIAHFNTIFETNFYFPISSSTSVGAFFALSGFLVFHSYLKKPALTPFIKNRARRILPPYIFIIILCAFSFFSISIYTPKEYFLSGQFWEYLISNLLFLNFIQPDLPGVFLNSPVSAVNASLWTLKVEWLLYLTIPLFSLLLIWNFTRKRFVKLTNIILIIYFVSMIYRLVFWSLYMIYGKNIFEILSRQFLGQLMYFYTGILIYFNYKTLITYRWWIISVGLIISCFSSQLPYYNFTIGPFIVSTLTIAISSIPGKLKLLNYNNISYEMYLFHFPLIQVMLFIFDDKYPLMCLLLALFCIIFLSLLSWFAIDKKMLPKKFI